MEEHEQRNASLREPPGVEKPLASSRAFGRSLKEGEAVGQDRWGKAGGMGMARLCKGLSAAGRSLRFNG